MRIINLLKVFLINYNLACECLLPPALFMKQMKNLLIDKRKLERCHENASNCLINYLLDRHTAGYIVFTKPTLMEI